MKPENDREFSVSEGLSDRGLDGESVGSHESGPSGVGAYLRKEREKRGLTYAQVTEKTKIRPHILEAVEKEDWEHLPAPVFVRGFVRSYARALGISEDRVEELYETTRPEEVPAAASLRRPAGGRGNRAVFVIVPLLAVAVALVLYFLAVPEPGNRGKEESEIPSSMEAKVQEPEEPRKSDTGSGRAPTEEAGEPAYAPDHTPLATSPEGASAVTAVQAETTESSPPEEAPAKPEERSESEAAVSPGGGGPELILKAHVKEGTWLRIFVDEQEPKEYILRPGSEPEWKAKEGFELLIGNAGGIDLEFNGEKIEKLGALGQVVRLRLPRNYERRSQDQSGERF